MPPFFFVLGFCADIPTEASRRRLVRAALRLSPATCPSPYEQLPLDQFVRGNLALPQARAFQQSQKRLVPG